MLDIAATVLLTFVIGAVLWALFRWVKTPFYRVDHQRLRAVLERVLTGQATEHEWNMTVLMTIRHNDTLEALRQQCVAIEERHALGEGKPPYLFSPAGLAELQQVLEALQKMGE